MRDVYCADGVPTVERDRSCQRRVGRTERTGEGEDEVGHNETSGGQEDVLDNNIIMVTVGDLVQCYTRWTLSLSGRAKALRQGTGSGSSLDLGGTDR
jgi:hypothetical protein